jgi:3-isopropylmalate/(R)-2-methylmalate dehydratase large subunit
MTARTMFDKIWDQHVVEDLGDGVQLLHVDRHLMHELSGHRGQLELKKRGIHMRDPGLTIGSMDHVVSTVPGAKGGNAPWADKMIETFRLESRRAGVQVYDIGQDGQGIVHVVGPELGFTLPGTTLLCGDSHTCTHGALGALAWGIGTSEIEHVLATQTIWQARPGTMAVTVEGTLPAECGAKDVILGIIARIGTAGGVGKVIEYRGSTVRALSMEGRMTICNMSIEAGARAGIVGPDDTTFGWLEGRPYAPKGTLWERALDDWRGIVTDRDARFDREVVFDASEVRPYVTWGTNPAQSVAIEGIVPDPDGFADDAQREAARRALRYQDLRPGTPVRDIAVDAVFIGSCTNSRLEDLRAASDVVRGRRVRPGIRALVVPGSTRVKADAEREGLDRVFRDAGFEWRDAGCSMCLGMNPDVLRPGERCASTSNRNFEGRQGPGGRTHLVSPTVAAATAIAGHFALPSDLR